MTREEQEQLENIITECMEQILTTVNIRLLCNEIDFMEDDALIFWVESLECVGIEYKEI